MPRAHSKTHAKPLEAHNDAPSGNGRALWRGTIGFGLVEIPVRLLNLEQSRSLAFKQLDKHDLAPVGNAHINKKTGKPVEWADVVKGYEISKGHFVVVDDEDFEKADVKATQSIDIEEFVPAADIPPTYFDRPYLVVPDNARGNKAYAILRDALESKKLAAVARVVIRTRQHLCAVMPHGSVLLLELLRFAHELRSPEAAGAPKSVEGHATPKELALAEQLINGMIGEWTPTKYKDTYRDKLLEAIHEKAKTGVIEPAKTEAPRATASTDLAALLEQSLGKRKKHKVA